jgi:hypothetical protein
MTKVHAKFTGNGNGGSPVLEYRIGYGTSSTAPQLYASGYDIDITNLTPGVINYFWAQARNDLMGGAICQQDLPSSYQLARG